MKYLAIKKDKPARSNKQVAINKTTMFQIMEDKKYRHVSLDYFKNHKPYHCDIKKGE